MKATRSASDLPFKAAVYRVAKSRHSIIFCLYMIPNHRNCEGFFYHPDLTDGTAEGPELGDLQGQSQDLNPMPSPSHLPPKERWKHPHRKRGGVLGRVKGREA